MEYKEYLRRKRGEEDKPKRNWNALLKEIGEKPIKTPFGMTMEYLGIPQERLSGFVEKPWLTQYPHPVPEWIPQSESSVIRSMAELGAGFLPYEITPNEMAFGALFAGPQAKGFGQAGRKFSSLYDKKPRFEIDDSLAVFKGVPKEGEYTVLQDIFEHPTLFKEYPWLKKLHVSTEPRLPSRGEYSHKSYGGEPIIHLNPKSGNSKETLLHEIQHAIQEKEGFARGGSPEAGYVHRETAKRGKQISDEAWNEIYRIKAIPDYAKNKGLQQKVRDLFDVATRPETDPISRFKTYQRLAGEIESRSAAERMALSPEARARIQPYAGDIPPEKAIVRFAGGESARKTGAGEIPTGKTPMPEGGVIDPKSVIGKWGGYSSSTTKPRYSFEVIDLPTAEERGSVYKLGWMRFDSKGNVVNRTKSPLPPEVEQSAIQDAKKFSNLWGEKDPQQKSVYLRFGRVRPDERSVHYISGKKEKGVSVYELKQDVYGRHYLDLGDYKFPYVGHALRGEKKAYLVEGKMVGRGGDNEPLLKNVKIVRELGPSDLSAIYQESGNVNLSPNPSPPPSGGGKL